MKKFKILAIICSIASLFMLSSCSIKKDDLEGAEIYTTVYPIKYLTEYLYSDYSEISSIYPESCDLESYKLTKKQLKKYANGDLFIYNGLSNEKELAKKLIDKNHNLLIIDVSNGLNLENDSTELWLSPNNYLMLAKNIKNNLEEYLTSKYIIEQIEINYKDFEEKISIMDASLHSIGSNAIKKGKNIIVTSNSTFEFLNKYGFEVISLDKEENLKENKLNSIKNNFKNGKYKYILSLNTDEKTDVTTDLINNYSASAINIDPLSITLQDNYFEVMTNFIENIKKIVS